MRKFLFSIVLICVLAAAAASTAFAQTPPLEDITRHAELTSEGEETRAARAIQVGVRGANRGDGTFTVVVTGIQNLGDNTVEIAVWPVSHRDNTRTYTAKPSGLLYAADVNIAAHGSRTGTYHAAAFLVDKDGNRLLAGSVETEISPVAGQLDVDANNTDRTSYRFVLKGAILPDGSRVVFSAKKEGSAEQKTWTAKRAGNTFAAVAQTEELGSSGKYLVRALCCTSGSLAEPTVVGTATLDVPGIKSASVGITLSDSVMGAFQITATAEPDASSGVKSMRAAVWTLKDQSDIRWYPMLPRKGVWTAASSIKNFGNSTGPYTIHVYAKLKSGLDILAADLTTDIVPQNYIWMEKDDRGCTIHVDNVDEGAERVQVPTWSNTDGQDDLIWYEAQKTGPGTWQARAEFRKHRSSGTFTSEAYVDGKSAGFVQFEVSDEELPAELPMRGLWVPSVYNLDFPRTVGNAGAQQAEFRKIVSDAKNWGFNTLFVQVRPHADALYASDINPWSSVLTGTSGKHPGYDPLAMMTEAAHEAGLELHAWLNPYRVCSQEEQMSRLSPMSVAHQHPQWLLFYDGGVYLDPANPEVRQHITDTVHEILEKYDVDGIHFDDYFYPYSYPLPEGEPRDGEIGARRRENVNQLVRMVAEEVHSRPQRLKFGISPFGVWKNASSDPAGSDTSGQESYYLNYCDTMQWVREGILDYIAPQLYWHRDDEKAGYAKLVDWWADAVSGTGTDLIIGQGVYKEPVANEIEAQLDLNSQYDVIRGSIFYRYGDIEANPELAARIKEWYGKNR